MTDANTEVQTNATTEIANIPVQQETQNQAVDTSNNSMVWISKTGKKYHTNSSCSNMKNPSQVSKSRAESMGLTPYSKCY